VDLDAVAAAVEESGRMLRADGADLLLVDADPATDRIRLRLEFDDARCDDCILPPDQLEESLRFALARRLTGEFELIVDDPRTA
jgi:hypothetical protein